MPIQNLPSYVSVILDGYKEKIEPTMLRTEFDDGYVRQDAKISRRRIVRSVRLRLCSVQQVRDFKCWLRDNIGNGAYWFNFFDHTEGRTMRARIVNGDVEIMPTQQLSDGLNVWLVDCEFESWY